MSDSVNPYQSPEMTAAPVKPLAAQGALTETMLIYLKGASPWLRFVGILGFIGAALVALWGVIFVSFAPLVGRVWAEIPGMEEFSRVFGTAFGGGMAVLFVGIGVLIFFPSLFMYRFGEKIRSYLGTGVDQDLELAFKNNKSFWKFVGILHIIELAFIPLTIIGAVIAAVSMALTR